MPEKIEASTPEEVLAGKAHNLPYFFTMSGAVTMDRTVLAGRFRVKWTAQPTLAGIDKKFTAFLTTTILRNLAVVQAGQFVQWFPGRVMMLPAIDRGECRQDLEIFYFFARQTRIVHKGNFLCMFASIFQNLYWPNRSEVALTQVNPGLQS